jgi:hypothetical protein
MREIKRERLIEERDILLFDILEELKKITNKKEDKPSEKARLFDCKYCGEKHEFTWQIAQCGKKNKKKEG